MKIINKEGKKGIMFNNGSGNLTIVFGKKIDDKIVKMVTKEFPEENKPKVLNNNFWKQKRIDKKKKKNLLIMPINQPHKIV